MLDAGSRSTLHSVDENEDVLVNVRQGVGLITLNRPKAINSLTHPMVNAISPVLTDWADNDDVHTVIVDGAGERGLCAGGDLVALYHSARADGSDARQFWYDEYLPQRPDRPLPQAVCRADGRHRDGWRRRRRRRTAASASSPTPRRWRCPKWASASFPTSAAHSSCRVRPVYSACTPR